MKRNVMDRFIDGIELAATGFIGIVAVDIFVSVLLRYLFSASIPDSYDFGRLLLGILIFWGIAATSYRGSHITVDLVWAAAGPRGKRAIDVSASLVLLFVVAVHSAVLFDKVRATRADNVLTYAPRTRSMLTRRCGCAGGCASSTKSGDEGAGAIHSRTSTGARCGAGVRKPSPKRT